MGRKMTVAKLKFRGCQFRDPRLSRSKAYHKSEVLAYALQSTDKIDKHAFIFKHNNQLFGVIDGVITTVSKAMDVISSAKIRKHVPDNDTEIRKAILLESV